MGEKVLTVHRMSLLLWTQGELGQGGQGRQTKQGHEAGASVPGRTKGWQLPAVKQGVQSIPEEHRLEWTASQCPWKAFVAFETVTKCVMYQVFVM